MEKFIHKAKGFFTVKNSLIVAICVLSLILIVQNVQKLWGRPSSPNFGGSMTNSRSVGGLGGMRVPGMGGGYGGGRSAN